MKTYLAEMKHGVSGLIPLIWSDHQKFEAASADLKKLEGATKRGYQQSKAFAEDDFDDEGLATAIYWDTHFGADKERFHADKGLQALKTTLANREFSRSALSSALLQYGKQGLSIVHGELKNAPAARQLHRVDLKDIIWQGRNHALHWEDGNPHKQVTNCFETLKAADPVFSDYKTRNLAFEVVRLLGWTDWNAFERDMNSLA